MHHWKYRTSACFGPSPLPFRSGGTCPCPWCSKWSVSASTVNKTELAIQWPMVLTKLRWVDDQGIFRWIQCAVRISECRNSISFPPPVASHEASLQGCCNRFCPVLWKLPHSDGFPLRWCHCSAAKVRIPCWCGMRWFCLPEPQSKTCQSITKECCEFSQMGNLHDIGTVFIVKVRRFALPSWHRDAARWCTNKVHTWLWQNQTFPMCGQHQITIVVNVVTYTGNQ